MNIEFLENFWQNKGNEIVQTIIRDFGIEDIEFNARQIERKIHEISDSYSKILFFESGSFLNEDTRKKVQLHVSARFDPRYVKKLNDIDLIAYSIKLEVIRLLENRDIFI